VGQTCDQAAADWIDGRNEHNGNGAAGLLQCAYDGSGCAQDHVGRQCNEFRCVFAEALGIAGSPTVFDADITADLPTQLLQSLYECRVPGLAHRIVRTRIHQHGNAAHTVWLLRARGKGHATAAPPINEKTRAASFNHLVGE
jgi:hypothetical protein